MNRPALVLAAHGSRHDVTAAALVRAHADQIERTGQFAKVAVAFHQGDPGFADVLDDIESHDVVVVPFMTSAGYYAEQVLPAALDSHRHRSRFRLTITQPVGAHPGIHAVVRRRAAAMMERFKFQSNATTLVIVGHGTLRNAKSRLATIDLVEALRESCICGETVAAFLDEPPMIESILESITTPGVVVMPFLIGGGHHVNRDVPARLGLPQPAAGAFPFGGRTGGRFILCDRAVGEYPELSEIVMQLAAGASGRVGASEALTCP